MALTPAVLGVVAGDRDPMVRLYSGGLGASDNDVIVQADDVSSFSEFCVSTTAGAVDITVSLDGSHYTTAPLSLIDFGATAIGTAVLVTAANRMYRFSGCYQNVRVLQNGATPAADVALLCRK